MARSVFELRADQKLLKSLHEHDRKFYCAKGAGLPWRSAGSQTL